MTFEQLNAFRAVALAGSFSAASRSLHKSQPALTKLVQNLEAELGLSLFDRSAYRATLSDVGQLFLERTAQLLERAEALRSFGQSLSGSAEPVLRLVVEAITPLPPLLGVLRDVQQLFPALRYELRTERMTGALEALHDASADLVIAGKHGIDLRGIELQAFSPVRIVPVARHDHPLALAKPPAPGALLRQYAQVVLRDSGRGDLTQDINVLEGGLRWSVTDVSAKLEIIHAGMGWGGMPEHVVAPALREGSLCALDVAEFHVREIALFVMRRLDQTPGPVAQALWSRLARAAESR
jgi:DNA-binding transcriptional LysR family regulator